MNDTGENWAQENVIYTVNPVKKCDFLFKFPREGFVSNGGGNCELVYCFYTKIFIHTTQFRFMYIYILFMKFIVEIHISSETELSRDTHIEKSVSIET